MLLPQFFHYWRKPMNFITAYIGHRCRLWLCKFTWNKISVVVKMFHQEKKKGEARAGDGQKDLEDREEVGLRWTYNLGSSAGRSPTASILHFR
jgi:hypothetical protein